MKRSLLTLSLLSFAVAPASGTAIISNNVSANFNSGPGITDSNGIPNQVAQVIAGNNDTIAKAETDFGLNRAYAFSDAASGFGQASSFWQVGFSLSGPGAPGTFVPLTVSYRYDFSITAGGGFGSRYFADFGFGIAGNNTNQGVSYDVFQVEARSTGDGSLETCPGVTNATPQQCLGSYSGSGSVTQANNWFVGPGNHLSGTGGASAALGTSAGFSTMLITGILVPDGVTWTYDAGVTGNPLNFHYAAVAGSAPEPGTLVFLGLGLAGIGLRRQRRKG